MASNKKGGLHRFVTILCVLVILGSIGAIIYILYPGFSETKKFDEIKGSVDNQNIDWNTLLARNSETVGWITVPGTHIDYPVVKTTDNDFYLTHDFDKQESRFGTPFLDVQFDVNRIPKAQNAVLYAHSSTYGNQIGFEGLSKYEDEAYFKAHPTFYFTTIYDGSVPVEYQVAAVIKADATYDYRRPDFADQTDFINYYNGIMQQSLYNTGTVILPDDDIATLSTCVFDTDDGRIAIIGKRISQRPTDQSVSGMSGSVQ